MSESPATSDVAVRNALKVHKVLRDDCEEMCNYFNLSVNYGSNEEQFFKSIYHMQGSLDLKTSRFSETATVASNCWRRKRAVEVFVSVLLMISYNSQIKLVRYLVYRSSKASAMKIV